MLKENKNALCQYLPPQGFGPEAKTRGGTLAFPRCIQGQRIFVEIEKVRNQWAI